MNRIIIFIIMLPIHIHINCGDNMPATNLSHALVDKNKQPTSSLLKLLEKNDCHHDGSLPIIVEAAQKKLLRQPGKERWETEINTLPNAEYLQLFKELHLIQEIVPTQKSYDYALLLGGVFDDVRIRLGYLIS